MVALEVIDHGCGMSQEVKSQVFEPFFTTKQTGSGSGLGCRWCTALCVSPGRVEIESAPGQGNHRAAPAAALDAARVLQ